MASQFHQQGLVHFLGAGTFGSDTVKCGLLKNSYTPNVDHGYVSAISASEADATGYTGGFGGAGRKTLSSPTVTVDDTNNRAVLDAADPATWTSLGGGTNNTLRYAFVCKEITSDAASPVLATLDMGSDKATNGGDFTVQFAATGIGYMQC